MTDNEWCRRVEQVSWVLKFSGQIQVKAEDEERLIASDKKLLGITDEQ